MTGAERAAAARRKLLDAEFARQRAAEAALPAFLWGDPRTFVRGRDYGCSDGGCVFGHPGGMHTNGGCHCLAPDRATLRRAAVGIRALRWRAEQAGGEA